MYLKLTLVGGIRGAKAIVTAQALVGVVAVVVTVAAAVVVVTLIVKLVLEPRGLRCYRPHPSK